ncbi:hypothetical protein D3C71_1388370 [compost metagenome]
MLMGLACFSADPWTRRIPRIVVCTSSDRAGDGLPSTVCALAIAAKRLFNVLALTVPAEAARYRATIAGVAGTRPPQSRKCLRSAAYARRVLSATALAT